MNNAWWNSKAYILTWTLDDMYYAELRSEVYLGRLIAQSTPRMSVLRCVRDMRSYAVEHGITVTWTQTNPLHQ